MKNLKTRLHILIAGMMMGFSSCIENPIKEGDLLNPESSIESSAMDSDLTGEGTESMRTAPDGLTDQPNPNRLPNPTVTFQEFIPTYHLWDHTKSLTWRIELPFYNESVSTDAIPTVFTRGNGALNSFNYLNSTDPLNTINSSFSLYYDQTIEGTINMWQELNQVPFAGVGMETFKFAKVNHSVKTIKHWVEDRPSNFESYMPAMGELKVAYNEGDIFLFKIMGENLYGGIRIVSMSPRIIEVYLAVPNI